MTTTTNTTSTHQISTLDVVVTREFKRDFDKLSHKQALSPELIEVMYLLQRNLTLPAKYKDHPLSGELKGFRDCHIFYDLVLIYKIENNRLSLVRINTHSEIFS